ncbi:MAG TPA: hypothetical protein VF060_03475 [Trebonia sp.]
MGLAELAHTGVLTATAEFDRRGRDAFLRSTGFRRANAYFPDWNRDELRNTGL